MAGAPFHMRTVVRNNSAALLGLSDYAQQVALLDGMARPYQNEVKRRLAGGYTSGAFAHGDALNHVGVSDAEPDGDGWAIRVGSSLGDPTWTKGSGKAAPYPWFWEVGHHNIFTRKWECVPIWGPALEATRAQCAAAFARVYKRVMNASGVRGVTVTVEAT